MTSSKGVSRFSISLPPSLVEGFDEAWKNMGYDNRSKAAHDAFRGFINEFEWLNKKLGEVAGVIILLYYLDKPGLLSQIVETQHKFEDIVVSTMHIHMSKDKCLEIITVKGKASAIRSISQELKTKKGVKQLITSVIAQ
jgi:CopG family nickel-responsive transcriptional regulator